MRLLKRIALGVIGAILAVYVIFAIGLTVLEWIVRDNPKVEDSLQAHSTDPHAITHYDRWFLRHIEEIVAEEAKIQQDGLPIDAAGLRRLKAMGFSDKRLANLAVRSVGVAGGLAETQARRSGLLHDALRAMAGATSEDEVRALRHKLGVVPVFKRIDSCAAEFEAITPYMYSTYEAPSFGEPEDEAMPSDRRKIVILGGGPNRIGQGIEFDYCCVHACFALAEAGYETIMVNCNPETVSTDYDTSDRLYFEPLTGEDVLEILRVEQQRGELVGVIAPMPGCSAKVRGSAVRTPASEPNRSSRVRASGFMSRRGTACISSSSMTS